MPENELLQRVRMNAKQTSKGEWYFDVTFEDTAANVATDESAKVLLEAVTHLEREFREAGKEVAGAK